MEYKTLKQLLDAKLGIKVSEFSEICGIPETTLRGWFRDESKQKALELIIDGIKYRKGW